MIVNVSDKPTAFGWQDYELRINNKIITQFKHKREEGLTKCLERAAAAAEKEKWESAKKIIDLARGVS